MRKIKGFTLVELMITVAVAAIALGIAIPSFNQAIRNNSSSALGAELAGALNFARSEAVKHAKRVSICASNDGATCLAANNWEKGWLVFIDNAAADNTATVTIGPVLRYWTGINPQAVVTGQTNVNATNIDFVRFTSAGTLARLDTEGRRFTARVTNCKGDSATRIVVGLAGMLSTTKQACP